MMAKCALNDNSVDSAIADSPVRFIGWGQCSCEYDCLSTDVSDEHAVVTTAMCT